MLPRMSVERAAFMLVKEENKMYGKEVEVVDFGADLDIMDSLEQHKAHH